MVKVSPYTYPSAVLGSYTSGCSLFVYDAQTLLPLRVDSELYDNESLSFFIWVRIYWVYSFKLMSSQKYGSLEISSLGFGAVLLRRETTYVPTLSL